MKCPLKSSCVVKIRQTGVYCVAVEGNPANKGLDLHPRFLKTVTWEKSLANLMDV